MVRGNLLDVQKGKRQLFVGGGAIGELQNAVRQFHTPRKYVGNPLMVGNYFHDARSGDRYAEEDVPREGGVPKLPSSVLMPTSVVRNGDGPFQMYYQTKPPGIRDYGYGGGTPAVAYAESHNGVQFTLPALGRVGLEYAPDNNLLFEPPGSLPCVVIDHHEPDPARRYKIMYYPGKLSSSPDGINWSVPETVRVPSRIGHSDGLNCLAGWDPEIERYVAYFRPMIENPDQAVDPEGTTRRLVGRSESENLAEWSELQTVIAPDASDPEATEFQTIGVFFYEGLYFGLLCVHEGYAEERPKRYPRRGAEMPKHSAMLGRCYVELVVSRDGIHWERTRTAFVDTTPGGMDSGLIWPSNAPVAVGDELWFYYGMSIHCHAIDYVQLPGLAKLRRDGFASVSAGPDAGWVLTEPFECPGGALFVNADAAGGELSVAVVEADGYHDPYYARVRCAALDADGCAQQVTWYERAGLDELKGEVIRLKFYLRQTDLFSFWFE
jgi:hypothetical protein